MARGSRIETDFGKPWGEVSLKDLREWHEAYGICRLCARRVSLNLRTLARLAGRGAPLETVQGRLRCTVCRNRQGNRIEVERLPRNL